MVEVEYLHLCDYAFPGEGGKPCIIGIFESILGQQFPLTHQQMYIAVQFKGTPHERFSLRLELGRPNGDVLAGMDVPQQLYLSEHGTAFVNAALNNVVFPEHGRYTVKVISGGRTLHTRSVQLIRGQQGPVPAPTAH